MLKKTSMLANIKGRLSRNEMSQILAGSEVDGDEGAACKKIGEVCSKHSDCCDNRSCYNADGENGKFRCH